MRVVPSFVCSRATSLGLIGVVSSVVVGVGLVGCEADLGTCNMEAATTVVYRNDTDGTPFYAGQAIVQDSCAANFCHSAKATGANRTGAPHGLNFDVGPITASSVAGDDAVLRDGIAKVRDEASDMYGEIESGAMPPGNAGMRTVPTYKMTDPKNPFPTIQTAEGKATVRNWLACGAPVISAVTGAPMASSVANIDHSQTAAAMPAMSSGTFADVYSMVIMTNTCTTCHQPGSVFPTLDLSSMATAYNSLVTKGDPSPAGLCTGKGKLVVPGDCDNSLLYQKLRPSPQCGVQMPQGGTPVSQAAVDLVCSWIKGGAKM